MTRKRSGSKREPKKRFTPPKLRRYGAVKDLTAGGATGSHEGSQGKDPFMA